MIRLFLAVASLLVMASLSLGEKPQPSKLSDAEITRRMVGKWEDSARFGNIRIHTVENFKKDGILEREDTTNSTEKTYTKATWQIKDGILTTVILKGFPGKGVTVKGKVVSIDDKSQFVEMEGGAEVRKTRLKE